MSNKVSKDTKYIRLNLLEMCLKWCTFAQMVQPLKKTWCKHHTSSVGMYNMAINMLYKLQSCVLWGFFMWQGVCNGSGSCHRGACASFLCIVQFRPKLWLHWTRSHNSTFSDAVVAKGVLFSSYMQKVKRTDKKSQQQQKEKKSRNTVIILIWSLPSADFICLCCFYLRRLIILETNLSACLQMAELRIILICTHTHSAFVHCFFSLSPLIHFQLLL